MNLIERFATADKGYHAIAGLVIFAAGAALTLSIGWGAVAAVIGGVLKEMYDRDRSETHTADHWDAFATAAPGLLIWLVSLLL